MEKARKQNDFSVAQKELNRLVELKREYAQQIDPDKEPYKVLFSDYEPYIKFETMEKIMGRLEDELVPIIDSIRQSNVEIENAFESDVSEKQQEKLNDKFLDILGYDLKEAV